MAVDPLRLTRYADQAHYRVMGKERMAVERPPMPSLDYKARLALQHSTRKGLAFEKFDEARAVGRLHDPVGLGTGFGVSDRATGPAVGAPRSGGLPPADDEDLLDALGSRYGAGAIGDDHLAAGCGAAIDNGDIPVTPYSAQPNAVRPRARFVIDHLYLGSPTSFSVRAPSAFHPETMPDDRSSIVLGNVSGPGVSASSFAVAAGTDWTVGPAQSSAADPFALGLRSLTVAEHGRLMLAWAVWLRNDSTVTVRGELSGVRHLTLDKGIGYEVFVPATFALTIVSNGIIGNKVLGGLSVADVSHLYRTAITPAGYAFAIWGPIYLAGAGFAGYCAMNPEFAAKVGPMMTANLAMNAIWIPMFCAEYQIPSLAVIWAMLGTSTAVWQQVGAPSGPAASIGEWLAVRPFTSLYTSWLAVACTVATASALTKRDRPFDKFLGAEPSTWAKAIVPTVAAITVTLGAVRHDATMPAVAAWALFAIGIKQRQDKTYPGDASVASLATAAGYVCSAAAVAVFGMTLYRGDAWVVDATS